MALGVSLSSDAAVGQAYIDSAINSANSGLSAVQNRGSQIYADAQSMRDQAQLVNNQANAALQSANTAKTAYDALTPYANTLTGYGNDLWNEGVSLSTSAKDVFGQGSALVNMDSSAGGLAGEYIKYWNSLSPDRYVSQAASDTQGSYQNAYSQAERELSRKGVSATSGAAGALQKQKTQALATALAAAKTKARQTGLDQQAAQLDKMVSAANTLYNMGNSTEANALAAKGKAADAQKDAAGILGDQAQGYLSVGGLQVNAGQLFGTAAGIYGSAAGVENSYMNTLLNAYGAVSSAQQAGANYIQGIAGIAASASRTSSVGSSGDSGSGSSDDSGSEDTGWVDLTHGKASHKNGAVWLNESTGQVVDLRN